MSEHYPICYICGRKVRRGCFFDRIVDINGQVLEVRYFHPHCAPEYERRVLVNGEDHDE